MIRFSSLFFLFASLSILLGSCGMIKSPVSADFDKVKHRPHLKAFEKGESGTLSSKEPPELAGIEGSSSPEEEAESLAESLPSRSAGPLKVEVEQSGSLEKRKVKIRKNDQKGGASTPFRSEEQEGSGQPLGHAPKRGQDLSGRPIGNPGPLKEPEFAEFERENGVNTPFESPEEILMLFLCLVLPPVGAFLEFQFGKEFWVSLALLFLSLIQIALFGASAVFTVIVVGMSRGWW